MNPESSPQANTDNEQAAIIHNSKSKKTVSVIVSVIVLILGSCAVAYYFLDYAPKAASKLYTSKSNEILSRLDDTVEDMYKNNLLKMRNTTSSYEEAKIVLADHIVDLDLTIKNTIDLEKQLQELKPSKYDQDRVIRATKAFKLARSIEEKYKRTLQMRDKIFFAYGGLPEEINQFIEDYYVGGSRAKFITQTRDIFDHADDSLTKMNNLDTPSADDKPLFDDRHEYLTDIKATFLKFNEYYRKSQDKKIDQETKAFSDRNIVGRAKLKITIEDYLSKSTIAADITTFRQLRLKSKIQ